MRTRGVVDGDVAVGMVITDDLADDLGALGVGMALAQAKLAHGEEDAAVAGLHAVAHIGDGAADIHAQRVLQVRVVHDVFDGERNVVLADVIAHDRNVLG